MLLVAIVDSEGFLLPRMSSNNDRLTFKVTVANLVLYALVMVVIAAALAWYYSQSSKDLREVINYGSSLFGAMVALLALLYTAQGIRNANDEKKRAAASRFIERWNDPSYGDLKKEWVALNAELDTLNQESRCTLLQSEILKRRTATEVLNFYEEMSVVINTAAVDEAVLKRFFQSILLAYWERYSYWIHETRRDPKWKRAYLEFETVATQWIREAN
jgi:hypothetical protein